MRRIIRSRWIIVSLTSWIILHLNVQIWKFPRVCRGKAIPIKSSLLPSFYEWYTDEIDYVSLMRWHALCVPRFRLRVNNNNGRIVKWKLWTRCYETRIKNSLSIIKSWCSVEEFYRRQQWKPFLKLKATLSGLWLNGAHRSFTRTGDASINSWCIKDLALSAV